VRGTLGIARQAVDPFGFVTDLAQFELVGYILNL
jgi:hypothetical protein